MKNKIGTFRSDVAERIIEAVQVDYGVTLHRARSFLPGQTELIAADGSFSEQLRIKIKAFAHGVEYALMMKP